MSRIAPASKAAQGHRRYAALTLLMILCALVTGFLSDAGVIHSDAFQPAAAYAADPFNDLFSFGDDGKLTATDRATETDVGSVVGRYRDIALVITSILTITMLIFMLLQFTKLGSAGDNEMARKRAIMGILTTGIATALLGGATIVIGFFWNVLNADAAP